MSIVTIGVAGIIAAFLAAQLRALRSEYAVCLSAAAGCFIFFCALSRLRTVFDTLNEIRRMIHVSPVYLSALLKMSGITYVAEFASGICRDAGCGAIANQIEVFGKLSVLAVSMPVMLALLRSLQELLV